MDSVRHHVFEQNVKRLCDRASDATALRADVLRMLKTVVPFDAHVWVLTDPVTAVGCHPFARVPTLNDLPEIIRTKYLTTDNRWTTLNGTGRLSDVEPSSAIEWRGLVDRYGVSDVASVVHSDRYGTWAFLDLWRVGGVFTDPEMALLAAIRTDLTAALRRCQARTTTAPQGSDPAVTGTVVVLVDDDLHIVGEVDAAKRWMAQLLPPARDHDPIPAVVYNVSAQLIAREEGVDDNLACARLHIAAGQWITARADRLKVREGAGLIAVSLTGTTPTERLHVYTRASGLSERETELVELLAGGLDTVQLAKRLHLSAHTVQDHLKSVFEKTGARSRRVLLSRALGAALSD